MPKTKDEIEKYSFEGREILVLKALKSKLGDKIVDPDTKEKTTKMMKYRGYYLPIFCDDTCFYTYMPDGKLFNTFNFTPLNFAVEEFAYKLDCYLEEQEAELRRLTRKAKNNYKGKFNVTDDSAKMRSQAILNKLGKLEDFEYGHKTDLLKILKMIEEGDMYYWSQDEKKICYTDRFRFWVYGHVYTELPTSMQDKEDGKGTYFNDIMKRSEGKIPKLAYEEAKFMLSDYGKKFALTKEELIKYREKH